MSEDEITPEFDIIEEEEFKPKKKKKSIDVTLSPKVIQDIRASGHCVKCGRYNSVPVIDGVPHCACYTN